MDRHHHFAAVSQRVAQLLSHKLWSAAPECGRVLCGISLDGSTVRVHLCVVGAQDWDEAPGLWTLLPCMACHETAQPLGLFEITSPAWQDIVPRIDILVAFCSADGADAVVRVEVAGNGGAARGIAPASWEVCVRGDGAPALAYKNRGFLPVISTKLQAVRCELVRGSAPRLLGLQLPNALRRTFGSMPFLPLTGTFWEPAWRLPDLRGCVYDPRPVHAAMRRAKARMDPLRKELMAAAWHPRRIRRAMEMLDT